MNNSTIHKVLVVGLGSRTGLEVSNFLAHKGIDVKVSDMKSESELAGIIGKLHPSVRIAAGEQGPSLLDEGFDIIVLSPGVPRTIPLIREAENRAIPVIAEIELAYRYMKGKIIAITGTDGKTTTTTLTGHILKSLGVHTFVGGNIGIPLISFAESTGERSVTVVELSSFQLETIETFRADVSAVLNVTPDHLDRYKDMDEYFNAKMRITMNQGADDHYIYNADDALLAGEVNRGDIKPRILSFSLSDPSADACCENGMISIKEKGKTLAVIDTKKMKLIGVHNAQNVMAAVLMVKSVLESMKSVPDYHAIAQAIYTFEPLEHRMEKVGVFEGRTFINDSKATTIGSVEMALKSITGEGILILGGRTKGDDYARLAGNLDERIKALVLIGESSDYFSGIFSGRRHVKAQSLDDAVVQAMKLSSEGDTILLSPACASFDMFKNYEERGKVFKNSFRKLEQGELRWM